MFSRIFRFLLVFCGCSIFLHAHANGFREKKIIFLERAIISGDTTGVMDVLEEVHNNFHHFQDKESLALFTRGRNAFEKKHTRYSFRFMSMMEKWHQESGNTELYIQHLLKSIKVLSKHNELNRAVWMLINIGNLFYAEKEYGQAGFFYDKAINISQKHENDFAISVAELNHGLISLKINQPGQAKMHFRSSIQARKKTDRPEFNCYTYVRMAEALAMAGETDSVLHYLESASHLYEKEGKKHGLLHELPSLINLCYYNYFRMSGNPEKAGQHLKEAREYLLKMGFFNEYLESLKMEAEVCFEAGQYKKVLSILEPAYQNFRNGQQYELASDAMNLLAKASLKENKLENSIHYFQNLVMLKDSLKNSKARLKMNQLRSIMDIVELDSKLELAHNELHLEQEKERSRIRERNFFVAISLISLFSILILVFLFRKLKKQNKAVVQLHQELEVQNEEVREKAIKLEQSNQVKNKLFSVIAHDLRAPLNVLLGQIGILRQQSLCPENSAKVPSTLYGMEQTLKETVDLFERLLQWSKLDKQEVSYYPVKVNLIETANQSLRFFSQQLADKNIKVDLKIPSITGFADANITQTIMRNLISNSIAALDENGKISIEAGVVGDMVEVWVKDNGKGFSKEWLKEFQKGLVVDVQRNHGLGLMLCKELAEMNKGQLIINGNSKGGSVCFTMQLYRGEEIEATNKVSLNGVPPELKEKLKPLIHFKVYQATQIKNVLKNLPDGNRGLSEFVDAVEKAVYLGNKELFTQLLTELEYDEK